MFIPHGLLSSILYLAGLLIFLVGLIGLYVVHSGKASSWDYWSS
jgi:hypothetical protein